MFEKLTKPENTSTKKETLVHGSGRSVQAFIERGREIGGGSFGRVYEADVALVSDTEKIRALKDKHFAVKEFHDGKSNQGGAEQALAIHSLLVDTGVSTWPTYRRVEGREAILMTNGEDVETVVLSASSTDSSSGKDKYHKEKIDELEGFDQAAQKAIMDAIRAGENGIFILGEAWFVRLKNIPNEDEGWRAVFKRFFKPRKAVVEDIFVGDYDGIQPEYRGHAVSWQKDTEEGKNEYPRWSHEEVVYANLLEVYRFVDAFSDTFLSPRVAKKYRQEIFRQLAAEGEKQDQADGVSGRWGRICQSYEKKKQSSRRRGEVSAD